MSYIPRDTAWFVAELVMEITVEGASSNVVHRNLILVQARTPDEAYQRAIDLGRESEVSYHNSKGQIVEIKFRGISKLDVIIDCLEHGAELSCEEFVAVPREEIDRWIQPKENLRRSCRRT